VTRGFYNVILCDDIRDEIGNKKSLMGVLGGDILVAEFPATIQLAFFMQYLPSPEDGERLSIEFRLMQDDTEIVKGGISGVVTIGNENNFILPKAIILFEKETMFRMLVSVNGRAEEEILSKRITKIPAS
jgi:hypothetical protein